MTLALTRPARRWPISTPLLLFIGSAALYVAAALWTRSLNQLDLPGVIGLLQRMVALGTVALGQTLVILCASIDLSVGSTISVAAVLASFVMHGDPALIGPAVLVVLLVTAAIGAINGLVIAWLGVSPLIATLGSGLILQGVLSANFNNFTGSVPPVFEAVAYGCMRFGAHLYAVGGNAAGARLAGIRTERVLVTAHVLCSLFAGLAGLYLASRLRSGAPWIGRDGVYDLESIAVVVIGGTLLSGGRGGVWGTITGVLLFAVIDASFNMLGIPAFPKQVLRGVIVIGAVAVYSVRIKGHVA
jgi:ribose transport system permease protein